MHGNHQGTSSHVQQNDAAKRPNSANSSSLESRENREQVTFGGSSMDLGIRGRWALVCAASKGLGKGCATALVTEGVNVVITARHADVLEATARELRHINPSVDVKAVVGDIATEDGRARALGACPQVDILINNAGGPPPGDFRDWDRNAWIAALDANMLAPIELMKATVDQMAERGFGQ
jgi:3-oxoacyl-[acyl-carrier protein] reductase